MWDPDERKITIEHGEPCRCEVIDREIWVRLPCRRVGNRLTRRRLDQLIHTLKSKK